MLKQYPDGINIKILRQFPEFVEFQSPKLADGNDAASDGSDDVEVDSSATPHERIDAAAVEIEKRLEADLLDRITTEKSPKFFERLVVDLIVKMGYGGSRENVERIVQHNGKSGDGGIDGIVNQDVLGLDVVYIQAKRYDPKNSVGREALQAFAGALEGKKATKGDFVATCSFTAGAKAYAEAIHKRIILIDGTELVRLLIRHEIGVRTEREIKIHRIDLDYFDQDES